LTQFYESYEAKAFRSAIESFKNSKNLSGFHKFNEHFQLLHSSKWKESGCLSELKKVSYTLKELVSENEREGERGGGVRGEKFLCLRMKRTMGG
jgi:hypothetical protein